MVDLSESMWSLAFQPLKTLYLHYYIGYSHQTWQGGDLARGARTGKVTGPLDYMVSRYYNTNLELLNPLITWACGIMQKTKTIISPPKSAYDYQTWQDRDLP